MATIRVDGAATRTVAPERATVQVVAASTGDSQAAVVAEAAAAHAAVVAAVESLAASGTVSRWTAESVTLSAFREWVEQGVGDARTGSHVTRYRAGGGVDVEFADLTALGGFVTAVGATAGVEIRAVTWSLTDATTASLTREVRVEAARDAADRAGTYAEAFGLGAPVLERIDEGAGRFGDGPAPLARAFAMPVGAAFDAAGDGPSFDLKPGEITVSTEVTAVFTAE